MSACACAKPEQQTVSCIVTNRVLHLVSTVVMITSQPGVQSVHRCPIVPIAEQGARRAALTCQGSLLKRTRNMRKPFSGTQRAGTKCASDVIVEGSTLRERPSGGEELTLYTHTLCPYAQRSYTTLLCKACDSVVYSNLCKGSHTEPLC